MSNQTLVDSLPKNWHYIKKLLTWLLDFGEIHYQDHRPRGHATNYLGHYNNIWDSSLDYYAEKVRLNIEYVPGAHGGWWTSKWMLIN